MLKILTFRSTYYLHCRIVLHAMKRSKAIVVFLILLFSFQFLPIKQVGSVFYCNQLTEELPHSGDCGTNASGFFDSASKYNDHFDYLHQLVIPSLKINVRLHFADEEFKSRSSDDINTPPPNNRA